MGVGIGGWFGCVKDMAGGLDTGRGEFDHDRFVRKNTNVADSTPYLRAGALPDTTLSFKISGPFPKCVEDIVLDIMTAHEKSSLEVLDNSTKSRALVLVIYKILKSTVGNDGYPIRNA